MSNPSDMLSRGNRVLLALLFRRFRSWPVADQRWLIARLSATVGEVTP